MSAQIYKHPGFERLTQEDIRRKEATEMFVAAEMARKHLVHLVKFWMGAAGVLALTLMFVLVAWKF